MLIVLTSIGFTKLCHLCQVYADGVQTKYTAYKNTHPQIWHVFHVFLIDKIKIAS